MLNNLILRKEIQMARIIRFCVVLTLIFVGLSIASDIDGKWKCKMQGPEGDMELVFNFKVSGDTLTGMVESPMGDMPISNGKVNGNAFSFDVNAGDMTISHQCEASVDSVSMKINGMQGDMVTILRRPAEIKE
jgi:hypothetical protein